MLNMKKTRLTFALLFAVALAATAQPSMSRRDSLRQVFTCRAYLNALDKLKTLRNDQQLASLSAVPDAYSYQLLSVPTLYDGALHQELTQGETLTNDIQLGRVNYINRALSQFYVQYPTMVARTEQQMRAGGSVRNETAEEKPQQSKLADKVTISSIKPEVDEAVEVETRKPNFWKYTGRATAQFQQNYFSSNWFQGGENNYAGNFTLKLTANYNDQKKLTWENTLEAQLGFQTSPSDQSRTFRPTSNNLRLTSNFGHKAWKDLYYSLQVIANTPIVPNYQPNSDVLTAAFASPLDITIAPGMKYQINWGKKHKITGTINVAPLAYAMKYVRNDELIARYGVCTSDDHGKNVGVPRLDENNQPVLDDNNNPIIDQVPLHPGDGSKCRHTRHQFGPNITITTHYDIMKNVSWDSRIYWFSNFSMTRIEWENTINFRINKYLTSQLYLYPRYDDSSPKYLNQTGNTFWMFKEWLSLGLAYDF